MVAASLLVFGPGLLWALGNMPTLSFMMLGAFIIHMSMRPARSELAATLGLAALLRLAYSAAGNSFVTYFGSAWLDWGGFLGSASLAALFIRAWRSSPQPQRQAWYDFFTAAALPYTWITSAICLGAGIATARTNDALLCAFDATLGGLPSFSLGAMLGRHPLLQQWTQTVYDALPVAAAFLLAAYRRETARPVRLIPLYISMMLLATVTYWLYPAAGPAFAFPHRFPLDPPRAAEILGQPLPPFPAPRNAMPSLHFGAMLVLLWNCRTWRWPARYAALAFALATAFATLALGQHYVIDLVVAFPYVAALQAVCTTAVPLRSPRRYALIAAGTILVAAWLLALRFAVPLFLKTPSISWAAILATLAVTVGLERSLSRSAFAVAAPQPVVPPALVALGACRN